MTTDLLAGTRVLDLGRYIAGPFAARLLADLGADVIKVEDPDGGDPFRGWQSAERPFSPQFAAYNRDKRSVTIDLGCDTGRGALIALARTADVLIENFRPGVADRLGIGYAALHAENPTLVYCAITGFGNAGPYVHRPSYDTIISAISGLYSQLIDTDDPVPVGPAFSDLLAGMFASQTVLAALVERSRSGVGRRVDVSMLGAMVAGLLSEPSTTYLDTGQLTKRDTRQRRAQAFAVVAGDGLPFVVHLSVPEKFWLALTDVLERTDLRDVDEFRTREARVKNYVALARALKDAFRTRPRAEWFARLDAADVPYAPVYRIDEVFVDPQVEHLGLTEVIESPGERPLRMSGFPYLVDGQVPRSRKLPPVLGRDTFDVLSAVGMSDDEIRSAQGGTVAVRDQ